MGPGEVEWQVFLYILCFSSFLKYLLLLLSHFSRVRLCDPMDCSSPGSSVHRDPPGKNTGVGSHFLLQEIFPTQGLNPCLLCPLKWQADFFSFPLVPPGKNDLILTLANYVCKDYFQTSSHSEFPGGHNFLGSSIQSPTGVNCGVSKG